MSLIRSPMRNQRFDKAHNQKRCKAESHYCPRTLPSFLPRYSLLSYEALPSSFLSFTSPLLGIAGSARSTNQNVSNTGVQPFEGKPIFLHHDEHYQTCPARNGDNSTFLFASRPRAHPDRHRNMGNEAIHFIPTRFCTSA